MEPEFCLLTAVEDRQVLLEQLRHAQEALAASEGKVRALNSQLSVLNGTPTTSGAGFPMGEAEARAVERQQQFKAHLALVRSVVTRTAQASSDLDHFTSHFAGRIEALARAQGIAALAVDGTVALEEIVEQELQAQGGPNERRCRVDGPPVHLPAKFAGVLGLAVHELTTNSIKYGALAVPSGRIAVCWRVVAVTGGRSGLDFEWRESGVPLTDLQPNRRGFGRDLIEQRLPHEFGAVTAMEFRGGGMTCSLLLTLPPGVDGALRTQR